jgi:voltage-gated potassium channel Kch
VAVKERLTKRVEERSPNLWWAGLIAGAVTMLVVLVAGLVITVADHDSFPNYGRGLWWAAQTVTTVGYGDVVPETGSGRVVAVLVMITGIGFITVVTGAIVSLFVTRITRQHDRDERERFERTMEDIAGRLERIEEALAERRSP